MAATSISGIHNQALTPVADADRVFRWHEHASLWFSLGVGLLVMQIDAYLVPAVGTHDAVLAIVLGAVTGAGLLHVTYNSYFARLPVLLNIAQLIGWTTLVLTFSLARLSRARRAGATGWEQA